MTTRSAIYEVVCEDTSKLERSDWLALRRHGLGSSDAAPVLNLSPWRSQYTVWAEKSGYLADEEDSRRFRGGRVYEEPTLRLWCEDSGVPFESITRHLMARSTAHPFMLANPDGLTDDAVIEVKTAHSMDEKRWDAGIPHQYTVQALHLMSVTGRRKCIFPVAFTWEGPTEFVIDLDDPTEGAELEASMHALEVVEGAMWRRIVQNDPPDPDGSESTMMTLRERFFTVDAGRIVQLPQSTRLQLNERDVELEAAKVHTARADAIKAQLMVLLGEAEAGELDGEIVCTWKADKNGKRSFRFAS